MITPTVARTKPYGLQQSRRELLGVETTDLEILDSGKKIIYTCLIGQFLAAIMSNTLRLGFVHSLPEAKAMISARTRS